MEAALLHPFVGETIEATVIELRGENRAAVQIADPAVTATAPVGAGAAPGETVQLRLAGTDVARGTVEFAA